MDADIYALEKSGDEYAEEAEATGKHTFITKTNSISWTAKENKASLLKIEYGWEAFSNGQNELWLDCFFGIFKQGKFGGSSLMSDYVNEW